MVYFTQTYLNKSWCQCQNQNQTQTQGSPYKKTLGARVLKNGS